MKTSAKSSFASSVKDTSKYKIVVKYGNPILEEGHTSVPNLILHYYRKLKMSPQEMMFIIHLMEYKWDSRDPFPGLETISGYMGLSVRQIQRYEKNLVKKKCLKVTPRFDPKSGQQTNEYNISKLVDQALALFEAEEKAKMEAGETGGDNPKKTKKKLPNKPAPTANDYIPPTSMSPAPLTPMSPEEYSSQKYSIPDSPVEENGKIEHSEKSTPPASEEPKRGGGFKEASSLIKERLSNLGVGDHATPSSDEPTSPAEALKDNLSEDISAQDSGTSRTTTAPQGLSAQNAELIASICREFGDTKINSTLSQIAIFQNQWHLSNDDLNEWLVYMRSDTRANKAKIGKLMGYFMNGLKKSVARSRAK